MEVIFHLKNGGINKNDSMILVFKTNIFSQLEIHVKAILDSFSEILAIDFDFEDADNILRIEATADVTSDIQSVLKSKGFYCEELI